MMVDPTSLITSRRFTTEDDGPVTLGTFQRLTMKRRFMEDS